MKQLLSNRAFQKALLASTILIGGLGVAGGAWLIHIRDFTGIAGVIAGAITLAIGIYGALLMKRNPHPHEIFRN